MSAGMIGLLIQTALFAVFMLASSYYFLLRKKPDRWKRSVIFTVIATLVYAVIIYYLKQV